MLRGVVFDFDGTLVNSNAIKRDCFFETIRYLSGSDEVINSVLKDPHVGDRHAVFRQFSTRCSSAHGHRVDDDDLTNRYTQMCEARIARAPEMTGAHDVLSTIKKTGVHLAISSATPQVTLRQIVEARDLSCFFAHVLGTPDNKVTHVSRIIHDTGMKPLEIVYVGDSEMDQQAARTAGCHFIGIGSTTERFQSLPHHLASTLKDLPAILKRIDTGTLNEIETSPAV